MSVDTVVHPSLVHRMYEPVARDVIRQYLTSRPPVPEIPATFRGPNWKKATT